MNQEEGCEPGHLVTISPSKRALPPLTTFHSIRTHSKWYYDSIAHMTTTTTRGRTPCLDKPLPGSSPNQSINHMTPPHHHNHIGFGVDDQTCIHHPWIDRTMVCPWEYNTCAWIDARVTLVYERDTHPANDNICAQMWSIIKLTLANHHDCDGGSCFSQSACFLNSRSSII